MPLTIQGVTYSELNPDNKSNVYGAVLVLPQPKMCSITTDEPIDPKSAIILFQAEFAHHSIKDSADDIIEMGTKTMYQCLTLYIYTENDHFMVHVDSEFRTLDLDSILKRFADTKNIKAMIVGGACDTQDYFTQSSVNLNVICKMLTSSTFNIELVSQKILPHNISNGESAPMMLRDLLISHAISAHYLIYGTELETSLYKNITTGYFNTKTTDCPDMQLNNFINFLMEMRPLKGLSDSRLLNESKRIFKDNKQRFTRLFQALFTKQGFRVASSFFGDAIKNIGCPLIRNFTVNIRNQTIRLISSHTPAVHEHFRCVTAIVKIDSGHYTEAYSINHYTTPLQTGPEYQELMTWYDEVSQKDIIEKKDMAILQKHICITGDGSVNHCLYNIRKDRLSLKFPLRISFNAPMPSKTDKVIASNPAVHRINTIAYKSEKFTGQERGNVDNVIDAVSPPLYIWQAFDLQIRLTKNNIESEIRKDDFGKHHVCVFNIKG